MGVINYTTAKINELLAKIEKAPETIENGKTPVFVTGTTTTLDPGLSATAEVVQDGVDENGNPKYKINFGVPKGLDGASGGGGGTADSVQWTKVLNKPSWVDSPTKPTYTASEVGALPVGTFIPSKVSDLTNDSKFLKSTDFKTINGQSIVGDGNIQIEGGSSGGTGNVNVTNASGLLNSRLYSFKPSKDGSLEGTFQEIANVNETTAGLMRSEDYSKLNSIKGCVYLPIAFEQVNSSTSKEELVQLFSKAFKQEDLDFAQLVLILETYSTLSDSDGNVDSGAKFFVGNNDCLFRGLYTEAENKLLTEFTYIAIGGKLKTISILFSNLGTSDPSEVELFISLKESGDDKIYLSRSIFSLSASSTIDDVYSVFGGEESFTKIFLDRDNSDKSFFILEIDAWIYIYKEEYCPWAICLGHDSPGGKWYYGISNRAGERPVKMKAFKYFLGKPNDTWPFGFQWFNQYCDWNSIDSLRDMNNGKMLKVMQDIIDPIIQDIESGVIDLKQ